MLDFCNKLKVLYQNLFFCKASLDKVLWIVVKQQRLRDRIWLVYRLKTPLKQEALYNSNPPTQAATNNVPRFIWNWAAQKEKKLHYFSFTYYRNNVLVWKITGFSYISPWLTMAHANCRFTFLIMFRKYRIWFLKILSDIKLVRGTKKVVDIQSLLHVKPTSSTHTTPLWTPQWPWRQRCTDVLELQIMTGNELLHLMPGQICIHPSALQF